MKKLLLGLFLILACSHSTMAQQAIQRAAYGRIFPTACPTGCAYLSPVRGGDLLVAIVEGACDATLSSCTNEVRDSKGQIWQKALMVDYNNGTGFYYAMNTIGLNATDGRITVYFAPGTAWSVVLLEFPPAISLDTVNAATYNNQNNEIGYVNGQASDWSWTLPLETSNYGDLIIGAASSSGAVGCAFEPGPQFASEAGVGPLAIEDMIATRPSLYFPSLHWTFCNMHWTMGAVAFKMK